MKLEKQFFIDRGWRDVPGLDEVLKKGLELIDRKGITDLSYIEKLLRREFPARLYTLMMGEQSPLSLAIHAESAEAQKNLSKAETQIRQLLCSPVVVGGSLMPDACPASNQEAALPVGGVVVAERAIIPAAHSADICCSMHASFYCSEIPIAEEMELLVAATRFGPGGRSVPIHDSVIDENVWSNPFLRGLKNKAVSHIADQGDGNHFAFLGELDISPEMLTCLEASGYLELSEKLQNYKHQKLRVLVTHHGSRSLGSAVYQRGLDAALKHCRKVGKGIPEAAVWLDSKSKIGQDYWDALQYVSRWTKANHKAVHRRFLENMKAEMIASFGNEHNFVWKREDKFYHGKGATPAWLDSSSNPLLGLIPLNMAEPILIVIGRDNQQFHSFAPHGAGRDLSRTALFKKFRKKAESPAQAIERTTKDIAVHWYLGEADLSESPVAYKDPKTVIQQIEEFKLADVIGMIQPRGSVMAGKAPKSAEKPMTPKQKRQMQHRAERRRINQHDWLSEEAE